MFKNFLVFYCFFLSALTSLTSVSCKKNMSSSEVSLSNMAIELDICLYNNDINCSLLKVDELDSIKSLSNTKSDKSVSFENFELKLKHLKSSIANEGTVVARKDFYGLIPYILEEEQYHFEDDPYLYYLLTFEEDMMIVTSIAMDPMLDLYTWPEFNAMVQTMYQSWNMVDLHNPDISVLDQDRLTYHHHTQRKDQLKEVFCYFQDAIASDIYEQYDLCLSAHNLREQYFEYLEVFSKNFDPTKAYTTLQ